MAQTKWQTAALRLDSETLSQIAHAVGTSAEEVKRKIQELRRLGCLRVGRQKKIAVAPSRLRKAPDDFARRLLSYLLGYTLTDHARIVRVPGLLGGAPVIAGTRLPVYAIAGAFRAGSGLPEIQKDFPDLTASEVEAAIYYYLAHKREADEVLERSELEWLQHRFSTPTPAERA